MHYLNTALALLLSALLSVACSDNTTNGKETGPVKDLAGDTATTPKDGAGDAIGDASDLGDSQGYDIHDIAMEFIPCGSKNCNDGLPCTDDVCVASGCKNTVRPGFCLIGGKCIKAKEKNSASQCSACDPSTSPNTWTDDPTLCPNSALVCTNTSCKAGKCGSTLKPGYCLVQSTCIKNGEADPKNSCMACDTAKSTTALQGAADGVSCLDDKLTCTGDVCKASTCTHPIKSTSCLISGTCYGMGELNPLKQCQECLPNISNISWSSQADNTECKDDSLTCTKDICVGGVCTHPPKSGYCRISGTCYKKLDTRPGQECMHCDPNMATTAWTNKPKSFPCSADALACTADVCDDLGKCTHPLKPNHCLISGKCYTGGTKQAGMECVSCIPATSTTAWSPQVDGTACSPDLYVCTKDVCIAGKCTHNLYPTDCLISGLCYSSGAKSPQNPCLGCAPATAPKAWSSLKDGTSCPADLLSCTDDVCKAGKCSHTPKSNTCAISGKCYTLGAPQPTNSCNICSPLLNNSSWSTLPDNSGCGSDNLACTKDSCTGGKCTHMLQSGYCLIANQCYAQNALNPSNSCQYCDTAKTTTAWSTANHLSPCTGGRCINGSCCTNCISGSNCLPGNLDSNCGSQGQACSACSTATQCSQGSCLSKGCFVRPTPGCDGCDCQSCVCAMNPSCCSGSWDSVCASQCKQTCNGKCTP